jgi:hypothetical protein
LTVSSDVAAFAFTGSGASAISYFNVKGVGAATSKQTGIFANAGTVTVSHLTVQGFAYGIGSAKGSKITINAGTIATMNHTGAIAFGGGTANPGGSLDIETTTSDADGVQLVSNVNLGLNCYGNAQLKIGAPPITGTTPPAQAIVASMNGGSGVNFASATATTFTGLVAQGNKGDGIDIWPKTQVKVRGSLFANNTGSGVRIPAIKTPGATDATGINLGENATTLAGGNVFSGNGNAGLCVDPTEAVVLNKGSLNANGNTFGGVDCTTGGTMTRASTCTGKVDIAAACHDVINVAKCSTSSICK